VDGTAGKATVATAAAGNEDGAVRVPAVSPLAGEVSPDHPMREAIEAAHAERQAGGFGRPGRALNHRSPFLIGMKAAAGVAVTYGLVELLIKARSVLILIGLAFFIAAGLDPVVVWLTRRGLPRWAAVSVVVFTLVALIGGFVAAAVPPLAAEMSALINELPRYVHDLQDHSSTLGRLNDRYHIEQRITSLLSTKGTALVGGVIGAGQIVISALSSMVLVIVLSVYFLAAMPKTKLFCYCLIPQSRRPRAILSGSSGTRSRSTRWPA
jgi:predicted PurR-regulated permease PerM